MLLFGSNRATLVSEPSGDLFSNPFIADSAHHRPIGSDAVYAAETHPAVVDFRGAVEAYGGGININAGCPYGRVVYKVTNTSPIRTINRNPIHEDAYAGVPVDVPYPASGVTVCTNADKNDAVYVFVNNDTGELHEFREAGPGGATNTMNMLAAQYKPHWAKQNGSADVGRTSGLGHGVRGGDRVGNSASGTSGLFGLMRIAELEGTGPILHVQQLSMPRTSGHAYQALSKNWVLPAVSVDGGAVNTGNIDYGSVLAVLPQDRGGPDLDAMGLTPLERRVAQQWRDFGLVPIDGSDAVALRSENGLTASQRSQIGRVFRLLKMHFRLITNCAWDPNNRRKPTGGGTPRAPNGAFDA